MSEPRTVFNCSHNALDSSSLGGTPLKGQSAADEYGPTLLSRNNYGVMGVILLLAIGLSTMAWKALRLESELVQSIALADARQFADAITEFRTLYASEVVERVRATGTKVTHDYKDH